LLHGFPESTHRKVSQPAVELLGSVEEVHKEGGLERAAEKAKRIESDNTNFRGDSSGGFNLRTERVEADAFTGVYHGKLAGQRQDGTLGSSVWVGTK
jgi:hypothetical protein